MKICRRYHKNASVIGAFSLDAAATWDTALKSARETLALLPPDMGREFEDGVRLLPQLLGLDLRNDLFAPLGDVHCFYSDPAGGPFGIGFGVAFSVKDADKLRRTVDALVAQGERLISHAGLPMPVTVQRAHVDGRQLITVPAGVFTPTVTVDDEWMVMSPFPQSVKTFFMRQDGRLPKWTPSPEHREALTELPQSFSAISIDDPRSSMASLYGFVPIINSSMHTMMGRATGRLAVKAADLPPLEVVVAPLFPNVSVSVPGESGVEYHTPPVAGDAAHAFCAKRCGGAGRRCTSASRCAAGAHICAANSVKEPHEATGAGNAQLSRCLPSLSDRDAAWHGAAA